VHHTCRRGEGDYEFCGTMTIILVWILTPVCKTILHELEKILAMGMYM